MFYNALVISKDVEEWSWLCWYNDSADRTLRRARKKSSPALSSCAVGGYRQEPVDTASRKRCQIRRSLEWPAVVRANPRRASPKMRGDSTILRRRVVVMVELVVEEVTR